MNLDVLTAKKEALDRLLPIPADALQSLEQWLLVELTYTSNALEGNTLTRMETAQVLEKDLSVAGKSVTEHLEAKNHQKAYAYIMRLIGEVTVITQEHILAIHGHILHGIDDSNAGKYRHVPVRIAGSTSIMPNHAKVPVLMQAFGAWLANSPHAHPVRDAAEAHYQLVSIHPFVDGNGRTARLLMNLIMRMHGYPPIIIRPEQRIEYLNALEKAQTGGGKDDYIAFILGAAEESLDMYTHTATEARV